MKSTGIFMLCIMLFNCAKQKCEEEVETSPLAGHYITLESIEGDKFCVPYHCLTTVTRFDVLNLKVGNEERREIICGERKLNLQEIEKMRRESGGPVHRINQIDEKEIKDLADKLLDSSGVLQLRDVDYNYRGDIINELIRRNYAVVFADYQGEYFWKKK